MIHEAKFLLMLLDEKKSQLPQRFESEIMLKLHVIRNFLQQMLVTNVLIEVKKLQVKK
jgi:hypothetical protein